MKKKEVTIKKNIIFSNFFIDAFNDEVLKFNEIKTNRFIIKHKGSVAVLPITEDKKHIILVEQFRYAIDDFIYELPAGLKDKDGELAADAVARELTEETGYFAKKYKYIKSFYPSVGYTNEKIDLFLAIGCTLIKDYENFTMQGKENISVHKVPIDKVVKKLENNEFEDSKIIITLLHAIMGGDIYL